MRGWTSPQRKAADNPDVPARSGRSRRSSYASRPPSRNADHRPRATCSPAGGSRSGPSSSSSGPDGSGSDPAVGASQRTRPEATASALAAGRRQPWSSQARAKGVKTRYGVPSALRTRPGETAYDDPERTSSRSSPASAPSTVRSRALPYGPKSALTCTLRAPTAAATWGTRTDGSPCRTCSRPPVARMLASSATRLSSRYARRAGPAGRHSAGSRTNSASTPPGPASAAASSAGWSARRRSRRNHSTLVPGTRSTLGPTDRAGISSREGWGTRHRCERMAGPTEGWTG